MIMSAAIRTLLSLLLLNKIAALSVSRFDERDIRNENDFNDSPPPRITNLRMDPAVASSDWPLRLADVEKGVTFTRTISKFPTDAAFVISLADDDCKQHDVYGDNECHFSWGQNVTGNFKVKFSDQIEEGDFIVGDFKLDRFIPWNFRCALCGEDCVLSVPVINLNYTIPMPKECPIPVHTSTRHVVEQLWDNSPTKGIFPTRLNGSVQMIQGHTGKTLVEFSVEAFIK